MLYKIILTFEFAADEILKCEHSNDDDDDDNFICQKKYKLAKEKNPSTNREHKRTNNESYETVLLYIYNIYIYIYTSRQLAHGIL